MSWTTGRAAASGRDGDVALEVFMFQGVGKRQYALSDDPDGRNIPRAAFGPRTWTFVRAIRLLEGELRPGFDAHEAVRAIRRDGYALIGDPFDPE